MRLRVVVPLLLLAIVMFLVAVVRSSLTDPSVVSGSTTYHSPSASSTTTLPWGSGIGVLPVIQVFPVAPADNKLRPAAVYQQRVDSEGLWLPELIVVLP
jgi:hypothetical protein